MTFQQGPGVPEFVQDLIAIHPLTLVTVCIAGSARSAATMFDRCFASCTSTSTKNSNVSGERLIIFKLLIFPRLLAITEVIAFKLPG